MPRPRDLTPSPNNVSRVEEQWRPANSGREERGKEQFEQNVINARKRWPWREPGRSESLKSSTAASIRRGHEINTASFLGKASNEGNDEKAADTMACSPATVSFHRCQRQEHSSASQLAAPFARPSLTPRHAPYSWRFPSLSLPSGRSFIRVSHSHTPGFFSSASHSITSSTGYNAACPRFSPVFLTAAKLPRGYPCLRASLPPPFDLIKPN